MKIKIKIESYNILYKTNTNYFIPFKKSRQN